MRVLKSVRVVGKAVVVRSSDSVERIIVESIIVQNGCGCTSSAKGMTCVKHVGGRPVVNVLYAHLHLCIFANIRRTPTDLVPSGGVFACRVGNAPRPSPFRMFSAPN